MRIGLIGLGKMGGQIALRLKSKGHEVVASDINKDLCRQFADEGIETVAHEEELIEKLGDQIVIWLMIPSKYTGDEIKKLTEILPEHSIIIDGGNSDFRLTLERAKLTAQKNIHLVDAGVSGGLAGLENGFSIMVGGEDDVFEYIEPIIKDLAQPNGYGLFGKTGAGHFVKMVHNGIEYGMMEAFAEGFQILKENGEFQDLDLAKVAKVWQNGSIIESYLNELSAEFLSEDQTLENVPGKVSESGEARWTLEFAKDKKILAPVIQAAFDRRIASQRGKVSFATKYLAKLRNTFGGHSTKNIESSKDENAGE